MRDASARDDCIVCIHRDRRVAIATRLGGLSGHHLRHRPAVHLTRGERSVRLRKAEDGDEQDGDATQGADSHGRAILSRNCASLHLAGRPGVLGARPGMRSGLGDAWFALSIIRLQSSAIERWDERPASAAEAVETVATLPRAVTAAKSAIDLRSM